METSTHTVFAQFNDTIDQWIAYLNDYTLEQLCRQPEPGSWSIGQVYVHIIDDTSYFVEQIATALLSTANSDKEMHKNAKFIFGNKGFPDMQIQGPATNTPIRQPQTKEELRQGLTAIKAKVNQLSTSFDFSQSNGKTEHPALWFFSATEWLQFAEMHMRHHIRQKKRIDNQLAF
ncbi:MAG TPA: DinB family protein [Chitinophaga sp.]